VNYEKFGIIATVVILAVVLSTSGIAQNVDINLIDNYEFNPNGASTKSIEQIKADNLADRIKSLQEYCEKLEIAC